ncbi:hypothetical protein EJB05_26421, partial [Eragrostis curvula]
MQRQIWGEHGAVSARRGRHGEAGRHGPGRGSAGAMERGVAQAGRRLGGSGHNASACPDGKGQQLRPSLSLPFPAPCPPRGLTTCKISSPGELDGRTEDRVGLTSRML